MMEPFWQVWNVDTGECLHVLRGHALQIYSVAFDGIRIASGGIDTTVRVWDAESGSVLLRFHSSSYRVCFSATVSLSFRDILRWCVKCSYLPLPAFLRRVAQTAASSHFLFTTTIPCSASLPTTLLLPPFSLTPTFSSQPVMTDA